MSTAHAAVQIYWAGHRFAVMLGMGKGVAWRGPGPSCLAAVAGQREGGVGSSYVPDGEFAVGRPDGGVLSWWGLTRWGRKSLGVECSIRWSVRAFLV